MLIISKFHDYYDSALSHGVDKTIVYERKKYTIPIPESIYVENKYGYKSLPFRFSPNYYYEFRNLEVSFKIIGFCGKIYPAIRRGRRGFERNFITKYEYYYTFDDYIKSLGEEDLIFLKKKRNRWVENNRIKTIENKFKKLQEFCNKDFTKFFEENKIVCFVDKYNFGKHCRMLEVNCNLREHEFFKIKDPYSAMQDIMMYISGVLGTPNKPMVEIKDVVRLEKHGFDKKTSFRKPPTKKGN